MLHIGYIGLGIMGRPTAMNLLRAGYALSFYARRPAIIEEFTKAGATAYSSPKELAAHSDVIFTNVPATKDVEEVLLGSQGIVHSARPGTIVIDMSTISATATKKIAKELSQHQIEMLDAPVSGGEQGAIAGTLSIMVGGKEDILEKVRPILEVLGKRIVHIGPNGAGQTAKACNQIIIAESIIAVSEAIRLAKASGVDPAKVRDALLGGFASSRVLEIHGQRMLDNNFQPGFKANLHKKDVGLALEQAHEAGVNLPAAEFAMNCLEHLVEKGHGELDSSALYLLANEQE